MADFISLVHLYCQKSSIPAPVFSIQEAEPRSLTAGAEFSCLQHIYRSTLEIEEETFQGSWEKSKADAKKAVAQKAWEFYNSKGNPFFTEATKEKLVNYTNQLNHLFIQIPLPHFNLMGYHNDSLGPFRGECYVAGKSFIDSVQYSKKHQAKESIAKIALMELKQDVKIKACLENKLAYKIDPKDLHQQFVRHFQHDSNNAMGSINETQYTNCSFRAPCRNAQDQSMRPRESLDGSTQDVVMQDQSSMGYNVNDQRQYIRAAKEQNSRGGLGRDKSHFIFPPERSQNEVPTPKFDDLLDRNSRDEALANYQKTPSREPIHIDADSQNYSSYYNGSNMWYTQPAFDSPHASPFGYAPPNHKIKPEQPDLVVVFDRKCHGKNDVERRNDLEEYANWSSRSERPVNYRAGPSFDFPPVRGRSRDRERRRSLSRSPPSHWQGRRRTRSRSRSHSRSRNKRRYRKGRDRRNSTPPSPLSIPANMGRYGTLIYEMAIENPGLGTPNFSTRPSPFIVHEFIAQLAIGHKMFLSATSHTKEIEAIEDVAKIACEELLRMLEISKKMNEYKNNSSGANGALRENISMAAETLDTDSSASNRKENINPIVPELQEEANNDHQKSASLNKPKGGTSKEKGISKEEGTLHYDDPQNDPNFISLEPAPLLSFTDKFKRVADPNKKDQMEAMKKKREIHADNGCENITRMAVGKVKGECSDED